jgi:hypothetical protein
MLSSLPYDDSYLDRDAENESVEGVDCYTICFVRSAACQQSTGRDKEYHEPDNEWYPRVCLEVALQQIEFHFGPVLRLDRQCKDSPLSELNQKTNSPMLLSMR